MRRLRRWRDHQRWDGSTSEEPLSCLLPKPPSMLMPPSNERRPVSPVPLLVAAATEAPSQRSQTSQTASPFFRQLPAEIRRNILIHAFGSQGVHIDLTFDFPVKRLDELAPSVKAAHCNRNIKQNFVPRHTRKPTLVRETSRPRQWNWFSSVCHRYIPNPSTWDYDNARDDVCNNDWPGDVPCGQYPGEMPGKCQVGAMGWLLSCRRAYQEGIEVLYVTNVFHIRDPAIPFYADTLFVPHHWNSIRFMELIIPLTAFQGRWEHTRPRLDLIEFHALLEKLPRLLPNVEELYLSVEGNLTPARDLLGDEYFKKLDETVCQPVREALKKLPSLRKCTFAVPSTVYLGWRHRAWVDGIPLERAARSQPERHWRPLPGAVSGIEGYWMRLGQRDMFRFNTYGIGVRPNVDEMHVFYENK